MEEIWKDILGYEGKYQASNLGNVRSLDRNMDNRSVKGRILKLHRSQYLGVFLGKRNRQSVHRLIALAFIPKIQGKEHVNHINGDKYDNRVENLEWCNISENKIHSYKVLGNVTHNKGKKFLNGHYV